MKVCQLSFFLQIKWKTPSKEVDLVEEADVTRAIKTHTCLCVCVCVHVHVKLVEPTQKGKHEKLTSVANNANRTIYPLLNKKEKEVKKIK